MKSKALALFFCLIALLNFSLSASSNNTGMVKPVNPREDATVQIGFDGLMAICFGDPSRVSIGILDAHQHQPKLTITKVKGAERFVIAMLDAEQLRNTLYIDLEGANNSRLNPTIGRYQAETVASDPNDFRWTIDMESDLYQRQLYVQEDKLFGKIHLSAGLFYAANLSEEKYHFYAADGSSNALAFNRQIGEPAAKINLNYGDALVIRNGQKVTRLVAEPGVRYEMMITNLPKGDMASMDHWTHYYDVIGAKVRPFSPVVTKKAAYFPRPIICNAAIFSQSRLN